MEEFCFLILVAFISTNSLDRAESVQLEELPLQTFDELSVDEWWDKDEAEHMKRPAPPNFGQNVHHQIIQQNAQLGQIEPNSIDQIEQIEPNSIDQIEQIEPNSSDQIEQIEPNSTDHLGQIEPNSTDQNPPLTESDHSDNAKNGEELIAEDERKRTIVGKFLAIKEEFKQKGKYSTKEWAQIERKISKHFKVNRTKIYKWKKEFYLSHNIELKKNERKKLVEKFDQRKAELKRAGFKNSQNELDKTVAKELDLNFTTIYNWKRELGQTAPNKYPYIEQKELMKLYYEIKDQKPKMSDEDITKILKFGRRTLYNWKKQFKRHQFHQNSVDENSVEEKVAANVQQNENSNSGSI